MLIEAPSLPLQENNGIPWAPIILFAVIAGGLGYMAYSSIKQNSLTSIIIAPNERPGRNNEN